MQLSKISWQLWIVLCAVGTLIFLLNIDYTAVNLAIVPVSEEIQADLSQVQWLLSAYALVWAAFVIPASRLADLIGKRRALMGGLILFMAGSAVTGAGYHLEVLIAGRILQGIGAALFSAPAWSMIFSSAPPEKQGMVMGIVLSFAGFGLAAGPTLGGIIIESMSWRWIFYINLPLGLLIIAALLKFAPQDPTYKGRLDMDGLGSFLLATSLFVFFYALNQIETWGSASPLLWVLFGTAGALMLSYIVREKGRPVPMVPGHLFRNKPYMATVLGGFLTTINFSMILVLMALYLQNTLHYTSYETGLIFISLTLSMGLLSPIGGKLIDHFGVKGPMLLGSAFTALSFFMCTFLVRDTSIIYVCCVLLLSGTGLGVYFSACNTAMFQAVQAQDLNVASGVYTMAMMTGNTLSVILATSLVVLWGRSSLLENLKTSAVILTPEQQQSLVNLIAQVEISAKNLSGFESSQLALLLTHVNDAFVSGLSLCMWIGTCCALMTVFLTWCFVSKERVESAQISLPPAH
jgi:EmrB/QacA subfamily drug resistance transporter